jgi:ankyrin repeat protein
LWLLYRSADAAIESTARLHARKRITGGYCIAKLVVSFGRQADMDALHGAIKREAWTGSGDVIRRLVEAEPHLVRERDEEDGSVALHLAVRHGSLGTVTFITDTWPQALQELDDRGRLPLHRAADHDRVAFSRVRGYVHEFAEIVQYVARRYPPALRIPDSDGYLPLHVAAHDGTVEVARILAGLHPAALRHRTREERFLPMHLLSKRYFHAVFFQAEVQAVQAMARMWPQSLREKDRNGWLPLHFAARHGPFVLVVQLHALHPRAIEAKTDDANSFPLHLACQRPAPAEIVRHLSEAYPRALREGDAAGKRPLHIAAASSSREVVQLVRGAWPPALRERDNNGMLPLHHGASNRLDVAQELGAEWPEAFREKDRNGWLPLHHGAAAHDSAEAIQLLAEASPPNAFLERARDGRLPLHVALAPRPGGAPATEVVRFLTAAAPLALQVQSSDGSLPLHLAAAAAAASESEATVVDDIAIAWPHALDVSDGHGMRPVHVAAIHDAPLGAIYALLRMNPNAVLQLGPDVVGNATAAPAPARSSSRAAAPLAVAAEVEQAVEFHGCFGSRCVVL